MPDNPSGQLTADHGIGTLRWLVTLYRRDQDPAHDLGLQETLVPIATVHAAVDPAWESTFIQSTQIDGPITHMITMRWQHYPVNADVVVRTTKAPDGTLWSELFRVRRTKELGGRKRFIQLSCELEHSRAVPDATDATNNELLTEPYDGAAAAPPWTIPG